MTETGWRTSRTLKINSQFKTQSHGAPPSAQNAEDAPSPSKKSIMDMLVRPGSMRESKPGSSAAPSCDVAAGGSKDAAAGSSRMFDGLVVYVNGSTFPLVSDHKLKTLLAENGARISLHLARRQVTHVILGRPAGASGSTSSGARAGCGGGLAGTKMDKEIRRIGGNGIKYVGVEWCVSSFVYIYNTLSWPFPFDANIMLTCITGY